MAVFFLVQGGRFTGGTDGYQGIASILDMKINQALQAVFIDNAPLPHRGNQRYHTALEHHQYLRTQIKIDMVLAPSRTDKTNHDQAGISTHIHSIDDRLAPTIAH
jgi:hypothetical protein